MAPALEQLLCETLDDITLIRRVDGVLLIEFVQVKAAERRSDRRWETAISGRFSLAHHRCVEDCRFGIASRVGVHTDLKVLTSDATSVRTLHGQSVDLRAVPEPAYAPPGDHDRRDEVVAFTRAVPACPEPCGAMPAEHAK